MSMLGLLCAALAALIGGRPRDHFRWRALLAAPTTTGASDRRRWAAPMVVAAVGASALTGAVGLVVAAAVAGATGWWLVGRGVRGRSEMARGEALVRAMSIVTAELSVGAPIAQACACAGAEILADDPSSAVGRDLAILAARVHLGGDIETTRAGTARPIAALWSTSARFGLPLGDLLAASRADLVARHRFAAHTKAGLAGPRATARVLAVLPVFGLLLGQAIGADPVRVLLDGGPGSVLLVVGTVLAAAGVAWSEYIVDRVLP